MRILLLTQLFQPEPNHLKGLTFAKELAKRGHEVEVLTGFPNYPGGVVYPGYKVRLQTRERMEGIPVMRVALYPSHDDSGFRRFLCYASFAISSSLLGPFLVKRPDVIHVYQGPATLALAAIVLRIWHRTPFVLDVQDLWPESVVSSGMLKIPGGVPLLERWCRISYRFASRVVVLSEGYKVALEKRGCEGGKIDVVRNWCDESQSREVEGNPAVAERLSLSGYFNVLFAGTMGKVQALDAVIHAASLLKETHPDVRFVFVGGGVDVDRLKGLAAEKKASNVRFVPRQPASEIGGILAVADALLIHLKDDDLGRIGIPQKTQAYLAAGKPIVMAMHGEAADLVQRAGAGILCEPENPESIADAVRKLRAMPPQERAVLGESGRRFYYEQLSFHVGVDQIEAILRNAAKTFR